MPRKKEEHKHIANKDKGDDVSKILGDMMHETSNKLLSFTFDRMLVNSGKGEKLWYQSQMSSLNAFKFQVNKIAEEEKKRLLKASRQGLNEVGIVNRQSKRIEKEINQGVNDLKRNLVTSYVSNIATIAVTTKVLKNNVTEGLYKTIREKIESMQNYGIVAYKNGRGVRWENYMEMKVRTDIQNDITKNMIKDGHDMGNVFYIAAYFGDCAKDHVDYQGKIYVDDNWESIAPKDRFEEIQAYISYHNVKGVKEVTEKPPYFTTRPNCRHYFQMISIDEVLGVKNSKDLNEKREEFGLNFNGKYKPEKYKALNEQRYNERAIRHWKGKLEADQKLLDKMPSTIPENERLLLNSRIALDKRKVREWQARQRSLIKANPDFLERNYDREAYGRMISDFGIRKELKKTSIESYLIRKDKRDIILEKRIENDIGKVHEIPKLLSEKYNLPKNIKIILRDATSERLGSIEHLMASHKKEIEKDYNRYISKIKESINNPVDVKKIDNNKYYLYSFFTVSKRKRKGEENPKIYMQTVIEKEKNKDYFTLVSAFPNTK